MARKADFARVRKVGSTIAGLEEGKAWVVLRELLMMAARYRSAETPKPARIRRR
jgi:hypothetical protein